MEMFEEAHLNFKNKLSINPTGNGSVGDKLGEEGSSSSDKFTLIEREIDVLIEMAKKSPEEHLYLYINETRFGVPETVFIHKGRLMAPPAPGSDEETAEPIDQYVGERGLRPGRAPRSDAKYYFVNISKLSKLLLHLFEFSTDGLTLKQLKDVSKIFDNIAVYFGFQIGDPAPDMEDDPRYMVLYNIFTTIWDEVDSLYRALGGQYDVRTRIPAPDCFRVLKLTQEEKDKLDQSKIVKYINDNMGGLERAKGRLLIKQVLDKGLSDDLIESIGKKYDPQETIDTNLGALKRKKRVSKRKKQVSKRKKQVSESKKRVSESKKRVSERKKQVSKRKKKKRKGVSSR